MSTGLDVATRSRDEIVSAIRALSPADWARLRKVAAHYAAGRPIEPKDLLQEAFTRALDGRHCPSHVDVVKFLAEAMRSIADGEAEKVEHRLPLVSVAKMGDHQTEALNYPDPALSAEAHTISNEIAVRMRRDLLDLFDDDAIARDIVEGMMADWTAEELRELSVLDQTAYESKRKLIRRRIERKYPDGWKP